MNPQLRPDLQRLYDWIEPHSRVLDLGCGDGSLLAALKAKHVKGYGVELDVDNVVACVSQGVDVVQADLEQGLAEFGSRRFDTVILSQTLQAMRHTEGILTEMLRVGREAIVTFPNFGFWQNRWSIALGRMPVTRSIPFEWYNTPNIHWCTLVDFEALCAKHNIRILERAVTDGGHEVSLWPNLLGSLAFYRLTRN
ncbi:methionine biosynthesis protein MetW [Laribacter hongkongensis]|jgi:methionine biosynthesis protein MetW|uniref:MetW multi-domain protein n=1 Tax=Laribacter hongkongensis TaxID=168471 RepID=A0A248LNB9_9NEIS|nr:methionine biosynthesis protein MetW [Laribacter hongkongensis]ASJ25971.1 MetW multi-domain protein [Laribacter hongkongensis]MBE5529777.1 methionine biosynthesis protein MetW [Laribacter hongkongensis]MCG8993136.1 methionine biosynthesis protein MetW [Laribacter hongkongensis]MCG8998372.1 methionine biosynthesis protein MetW [Laribacter hongkongensis]MCG9000647.1 methionine biosynthesis protein MetW [Laribacter hongkongensis]